MLHFEIGKQHSVDLVLYIPNLKNIVDSLAGDIESVFENYHRPDRVFFIIPSSDSELYVSSVANEKKFQHNIRRYGEKVELCVFSFDVDGVFNTIESRSIFDQQQLNRIRDKVVTTGLTYLAKKNKVIEKSPPGSAFLKPSKDKKTDFIAAHRLAQSHTECSFVSFCLLAKLGNLTKFETIFIDTSAISYLVLSTINLVNQLTQSISFQPTFKSFHSYRGLETSSPKYGEKAMVLISASSSNNMVDKVLDLWKGKVSSEDVLTLLSFKPSENVLCAIPSVAAPTSNNVERYVKRVDEYFTMEHATPKSVVLKKIHANEINVWPFEALSQSTSLRCNSPKRSGFPEKEMTLKLESLPDETCEELDEWWAKILNWHIPLNTKYIITDTSDSFLHKYIEPLTKELNSEVIDFTEVINRDFEKDQCAVLVLLSVLGSGDKFICANRDLRLAGHDGMRIFVSFFHLYKSKAGLSTFKKSLLYGPELTKYKFFSRYSLNVPSRFDESCWSQEKNFFDNNPDFLTCPELKSRHELLSKVSEGLNGNIGLNCREPGENLSFTRHFAFWNFDYDPAGICPEAVYFTVASILQSARDDFIGDPENSLEASPHQQTLLSPENFVRFNDPLIQSCLWRAAKGSELDYSSDEKLADDFVSIMERLSRAINMERGEGFADLLLGVVIGKIVLSDKALDKLKALLTELLEANNNSTILALTEVLKR